MNSNSTAILSPPGFIDAIASNIYLPQIVHVILPEKGVKERVKLLLRAEYLLLYRKNYELWEPEHDQLVDFQSFDLHVEIEPHEELGVTIVGEQPVRVSRVFINSPADFYGIQPDDVIGSINGVEVSQKKHDIVVELLKSLSGIIILNIIRAKFIDLAIAPDKIPASHSFTLPLLSGWTHFSSIPLLHASITFYKSGTAIRLENGFNICSYDGEHNVIIHYDHQESAELSIWVVALMRAIQLENLTFVNEFKNESILIMGWLFERLEPLTNYSFWDRKFLVCTENDIRIFSKPPSDGHSWEQFEASYRLLTTSYHLLQDKICYRSNSFLLRSEFGTQHIFSAETWDYLITWLDAFNSSISRLVNYFPSIKHIGVWRKNKILFVINIALSSFQLQDIKGTYLIHSWAFSAIKSIQEFSNSLLLNFFKSSLYSHDITSIQIQFECVFPVINSIHSILLTKVSEDVPQFLRTFTLRTI